MSKGLKIFLWLLAIGAVMRLIGMGWDALTGNNIQDTATTKVVQQGPTQDDIAMGAAFMIRKAIRAKAADPDGVDFIESTYESHHDSVYDEKYIISGKNAFNARVRAAGYAKVKYLGGDPNDGNNWKLIESYIDE